MKIFTYIFSALIVFIFSISLNATPVIMGKHANMSQDGKTINCAYCHTPGLNIPQQKGQIKDGKLNGKKYSAIKGCNGKGCHVK
ncbi:MAG TPA: hypothetical protein PLH88_03490 [Spirochaetota bacterium]|nr:hypothetical protein [Spirochaetota bacterium]